MNDPPAESDANQDRKAKFSYASGKKNKPMNNGCV